MARVYVEQFGYWWSLDLGSAEKFLDDPGWFDAGWDLDKYGRQLKTRPGCILKSADSMGTSYWNSSNHHLFFRDALRLECVRAREG